MTVIQKTIGRLPVNLGDYDSTRAYGRKNRVTLYGCEWESLVENNTYPPATLVGGVVTPDTTHWRLNSGVPENYDLNTEIGTDNTPGTIKGRIKSLEDSVGTGGTVDQKIAAETTRATGAESALDNRVTSLETEVGTGGGSNTLSSRVTALESGKADKATTIAGYGITDAYTQASGQALEDSVAATLAEQDSKIDLLNGSEVVVVADHTAVSSPDDQIIYREYGTTSYTDWMYQNGAWQDIATYSMPGLDNEPTAGSENLVKSGGVANLFLTDVPIETTWESGKIMNASGYIIPMTGWSTSDSFILDEGVTITGVFGGTNSGYSVCGFFDEGSYYAFQRFTGTDEEQTFTVPRRCYVRLSVNDTANPTHSIFVPGLIDLKQLSDDVEYIKEHSVIKKSIWEGKKVGFLGDSTSASGTSTYVENYVALTGCLAQNYAIGGTSVADNGQPNPMCTRYSVLPADLDMVLILGGVNDHRAGIPLGNFKDFNNDGSLNGTFYGALHTLIRGLKVKYLDKPIVYMTPMHNNYMDGTYGDTGEYNYNQLQLGKLVENKFPLNNGNIDEATATGGTLSEYILAIKKVCSFYGVPVIDLHDICGIQPIIPANKAQYLPDGIHPSTQAGGKRMAEAVYPYLEQIYQ